MPQIEQLPMIFASQLFWLAVVFGILFFGIGRGMVPKIQSTVELREKKIAEDLAGAQAARAEAEQTEASYRAGIDAARSESAALTREAGLAAARDTEDKVRVAADRIAQKVAKAEDKIRAAAEAARAEVEAVAVEATQDMIAKLTGVKVGRDEAAAAVKAEFHV